MDGSPYRRTSAVNGELCCPSCYDLLVARELGGCPLHECGGCRGVWLAARAYNRLSTDPHAQEQLLAALPSQSRAIETDAVASCPRCGDDMIRQAFARRTGVPVDACRRHGLWFQRGELAAVLEYLLDPLAAPAGDGGVSGSDDDAEARRDRELREVLLDPGRLPKRRSGWFWAALDVLTRRVRW